MIYEPKENNLSISSIKNLFEDKNFDFVDTSMKDGSPHITPTWIDIEDGYKLINTAIGQVKQKNLARDPRVAVSVVDNNNSYNVITIR